MASIIRKQELSSTRIRLINAAAAEFNESGFFATDTNQIARRAGFSPQTFYRHFGDKSAIFVAAYGFWVEQEELVLRKAIMKTPKESSSAQAQRLAKTLIKHHTDWAVFRRSLRWLTVEDNQVRQARTSSRIRQVVLLKSLAKNSSRTNVELFAAILSLEALCDALADAITQDMEISQKHWLLLIASAVGNLMVE